MVIQIRAVTTLVGAQRAIDRCFGAVEFSADGQPVIARHNFCGGWAMLDTHTGEIVEVRGFGFDGLYRVNGTRRYVPSGSSTTATWGMGDLVLQTCDGDVLTLAGLSRIS